MLANAMSCVCDTRNRIMSSLAGQEIQRLFFVELFSESGLKKVGTPRGGPSFEGNKKLRSHTCASLPEGFALPPSLDALRKAGFC
jgi:hypothetical protein